jgi:predicted SprT family Zn-dependent metalloprotease
LLESDAVQLAHDLMQEWGLEDWCFKINRRRRSLGMCFFESRRIELSAIYLQNNSAEHVIGTLLHEIAHALTPNHGHDKFWLEAVVRIGGRAKIKCSDAKMPLGNWRAQCPSCDKTFSRHRKPRVIDIFHCTVCGEERGTLEFQRTAELKPMRARQTTVALAQSIFASNEANIDAKLQNRIVS